VPVAAIARRTGVDRKTVRKFLQAGLDVRSHGPHLARSPLLDAYHDYSRERVVAYPNLSGSRLLRELGYAGGHTQLTYFLREIMPARPSGLERRFETPAGQQA